VLGTQFQLACVQRDDVSECACGIRLGAAHDGIALWVFRPLERIGPADAWVQDDALVEPGGCGGRGARGSYDTDAVGKERDAEGCARVQVLADEEVAVVEGGGGEGYDGLAGGVKWERGLGRMFTYFIVFWLRCWDCDFLERVVDFSRLAVDFLDGDGGGHCRGEELRARLKLVMIIKWIFD
jgi:hypothetical protein